MTRAPRPVGGPGPHGLWETTTLRPMRGPRPCGTWGEHGPMACGGTTALRPMEDQGPAARGGTRALRPVGGPGSHSRWEDHSLAACGGTRAPGPVGDQGPLACNSASYHLTLNLTLHFQHSSMLAYEKIGNRISSSYQLSIPAFQQYSILVVYQYISILGCEHDCMIA